MLVSNTIYDQGHQWVVFARDPNKLDGIIDTNQVLIKTDREGILLDPGGIELFSPMLTAVSKVMPIDRIKTLFASHQDPDIISSLGLWDQTLENTKLYGSWLWESFLRHFGMENIEYVKIPDDGLSINMDGVELQLIPAHYLHSSGNFNVYDPKAKILFSGDVGAALEPHDAPLFIEDMDSHYSKMELFHRRWMPSNRAKQHWIDRVRRLEINLMVPQHGRIFEGDQIKQFLNWFEGLDVGTAVQ